MVSTQENTSADKKAPLLSIGMIFKNEERCLERCLQALAPLREAIDCELVMADTGSSDKSREIAAKYADILFDFPWINDFSAARNAVMDRCSGEWFLTVDADEYLDADISELTDFLSKVSSKHYDFATIVQRNYNTYEIPSADFFDFYAMRLMRMATKQRYEGRIHETWVLRDEKKLAELSRVILHHDGYVNETTSRTKAMRNLPLLELELADQPDSVRVAMQAFNASYTTEQFQKYGNIIAELVETHCPDSDTFGAPALRDAIAYALSKHLPELEKWLSAANALPAETPFYSIDITFLKAVYYRDLRQPQQCLEQIRQYQKGLSAWKKEKNKAFTLALDVLSHDTPFSERRICLLAAESHALLGHWEDALEDLRKASAFQFQEPCDAIDTTLLSNLLLLRKNSHADLSPFVQCFSTFTLSAALKDLVSFLLTETAAQAEALLSSISEWERVSPFIPEHALKLGAYFPDAFYARPIEILQESIKQLLAFSGKQAENLLALCKNTPVSKTPAQAAWYYHLTAAAIQSYDPENQDFSVIHTVFLKQTEAYLYTFYQPAMLTEAHIQSLTPTEQFSWYLLQAQSLLEKGSIADCVRCLRAGLKIAPHMKSLIQYLLEQVNKPPKPEPVSSELLMLAEKIRSILSAFPPDDPSVLALKASPVYQQVAHLIEQPDPNSLH